MPEKPSEYVVLDYIFYFSGASNLRSFQDMYLKFAENVDTLVHIVRAKLYNFKM